MTDSRPLIADISKDYDLLRAYLLLAKRMFPAKWTPNHCELQMPDNSKFLAAKSAEKKEIDFRMAELKEERERLDKKISKNTDNEIVGNARRKRDEVNSEISTLYSRLALFPDIPGLEQDVERYQRRVAVEEKLIKAISNKEIRIWSMFSIPEDRGPWEKQPGYKYDIQLSTVWWPRRVHEGRRQFVRVFKDIFDEWLKTIAPSDPGEFEKLPPEEKALVVIARILSDPDRAILKRDMFVEDVVEASGISKERAKTLWRDAIPKHRKLEGAPRKAKPGS